jgi:hypothetical protein
MNICKYIYATNSKAVTNYASIQQRTSKMVLKSDTVLAHAGMYCWSNPSAKHSSHDLGYPTFQNVRMFHSVLLQITHSCREDFDVHACCDSLPVTVQTRSLTISMFNIREFVCAYTQNAENGVDTIDKTRPSRITASHPFALFLCQQIIITLVETLMFNHFKWQQSFANC